MIDTLSNHSGIAVGTGAYCQPGSATGRTGQQRTMEEYLPLVERVYQRLNEAMNPALPHEVVLRRGISALRQTVDSFDPKSGKDLGLCALVAVEAEMVAAIRENDRRLQEIREHAQQAASTARTQAQRSPVASLESLRPMVRKYTNSKDYEVDARCLALDGWQVSCAEYPRRPSRLSLLFGRPAQRSEIVVTYERM